MTGGEVSRALLRLTGELQHGCTEPAVNPAAFTADRRKVPSTNWNDGGELMNLSARNQRKGTVVEAKKAQTTAHIPINIGSATLTASITNEAVDELKLAKGMTVYAVIKASDVMVGVV
jgi:molybdopterin-binding protein